MGLYAGGLQTGHGRGKEAVEYGVAGFLAETERLIEGDLVALYAVAGDSGNRFRHDDGTVDERLAEVAHAAVGFQGDRPQWAFRRVQFFQVFAEVVAGVLAGLREVVDVTARPPLGVAGVCGVHER